jgi:hypothetical protein
VFEVTYRKARLPSSGRREGPGEGVVAWAPRSPDGSGSTTVMVADEVHSSAPTRNSCEEPDHSPLGSTEHIGRAQKMGGGDGGGDECRRVRSPGSRCIQ